MNNRVESGERRRLFEDKTADNLPVYLALLCEDVPAERVDNLSPCGATGLVGAVCFPVCVDNGTPELAENLSHRTLAAPYVSCQAEYVHAF